MPLLLLFEGEKCTDEETGEPKEIDRLEVSEPSPSPTKPAICISPRIGKLQVKMSDDCLNKMPTVI